MNDPIQNEIGGYMWGWDIICRYTHKNDIFKFLHVYIID